MRSCASFTIVGESAGPYPPTNFGGNAALSLRVTLVFVGVLVFILFLVWLLSKEDIGRELIRRG